MTKVAQIKDVSRPNNVAPILTVQGLGKSFGAVRVLNNIDFSMASGEVVAIIGPSGSGKSTFLRCINQLEPPASEPIK